MKHQPALSPPRPARPMRDLIAQARRDYAAGDGVDHAVVSEWLRTWGTPGRKPFKEWLNAWDG